MFHECRRLLTRTICIAGLIVTLASDECRANECASLFTVRAVDRLATITNEPFFSRDFFERQPWIATWKIGAATFQKNNQTLYVVDSDGFYVLAHVTDKGELLSDFRLKRADNRS